ncbi:MAG TPA: ankyrin repeat domain-containing protein, partial [Gammaproteobacteria bacterium]|nr:ankyrin repeat domain-containing protein [Gammaproteobacteria bacterium]
MTVRFAALALAAFGVAATAAGQSLLEAAEAGEHDAALAALKEGGDVDARGPDGTTALIWAAYNDDAELVERLLAAGADANAQNEFGTSALSEAAIGGYADVIAELLKGGADANLTNPEGETPLMEVARTGNVEAATLLLDAGADVNAIELWGQQSALMWAAAQKHPQMIKLLISRGADVNARGAVRNWERKVIREPRPKDMNQGGFTPLLYAAREGCIECAKELVAGGADLDLPDPHRVTPLVMALLNLHFDMAAYLIEAGADVNKWDLYGRSPLYMAADTSTLPVQGNGSMVVLPSMDKLKAIDVARLLLEKGANVNAQLKLRPPYRNVGQDRLADPAIDYGATPLLRAAKAGDVPAMKALLAAGALVDLPNAYGHTPLIVAAGATRGRATPTRGGNYTEEQAIEAVKVLLAAGADVRAAGYKDPDGKRGEALR